MFIYRHNPYTNRYYTYDTDEHDIFSPMFDETLHTTANDPSIEINSKLNPAYYKTCAFCGTDFCSRNQLFKHLAYMGVDIKKQGDSSMIEDVDEEWMKRGLGGVYDSPGDMGFSLTRNIDPHRTPPEAIAYSNSKARRARVLKRQGQRTRRTQEKKLSKALESLGLDAS